MTWVLRACVALGLVTRPRSRNRIRCLGPSNGNGMPGALTPATRYARMASITTWRRRCGTPGLVIPVGNDTSTWFWLVSVRRMRSFRWQWTPARSQTGARRAGFHSPLTDTSSLVTMGRSGFVQTGQSCLVRDDADLPHRRCIVCRWVTDQLATFIWCDEQQRFPMIQHHRRRPPTFRPALRRHVEEH